MVHTYFVLLIVCSFFLIFLQVAHTYIARSRRSYKMKRSHFSLSRIRISVPTKFRARGRFRKLHSKSLRKKVFANVRQLIALEANLDELIDDEGFDSSRLCYVDNCANTHIWSNAEDFEDGSLKPIGKLSSVATIGGSNFYPEKVGRLPLTWKDDSGSSYSIVLDDVLFFPRSPVNILSVTALANQLDDDSGTYVKTCRNSSEFVWHSSRHRITLQHGQCQLPEMRVNEGYEKLKMKNNIFSLYCGPCSKQDTTLPEDLIDSSVPGVIPRLAVYFNKNKLDPPSNSTETIATPFTSNKPLTSNKFKIGDLLRYTKDGFSDFCTVNEISMKDLESPVEYKITLESNNNTITCSKECLSQPQSSDVSDVSLSENQVQELRSAIDSWQADTKTWSGPTESKLLREFKGWHNTLKHLPFQAMFKLCDDGVLPKKFLRLKDQTIICPSCIISKMKRKRWRSKGDINHIRKLEDAHPGGCVSTDQMVSKQPGLVPKQDGRHGLARIQGATVYVDNDSGFGYSHFQTSLDLEQTIDSKHAFESVADSYGVSIKKYLADNGIFAKKGFKDAVAMGNQSIRFCAVSAHHQNGIVERKIQSWTNDSRTLLIHAQRHWPEMISSILWPYAWKEIERRDNIFGINKHGRHPIQAFGGSKLPFTVQLRDQHTWGCPVYVLESKAADGKMPKWDPKARLGIYLGQSPAHAGSVALVLNPRTLHVSPQFHCVFDDDFSTVPYLRKSEMPPNWTELVVSSREKATDEMFDLATRWSTDSTLNEDVALESDHTLASINEGESLPTPRVSNTHSTPAATDPVDASSFNDFGTTSDAIDDPMETREKGLEETKPENVFAPRLLQTDSNNIAPPSATQSANPSYEMPKMADLNDFSARRSKRVRKPTMKAKESSDKTVRKLFNAFCLFPIVCFVALTVNSSWNPACSLIQKAAFHTEQIRKQFDVTINSIHHAYLSTVDNGVYTLKDMLQQKDKNLFITAMSKEIDDHESRNHWTLMLRDDMPTDSKTIMSIWSFKRKVLPDGRVLKHKARLCAHGGQQTWGTDYWETYAPVVNWLSVRILFALTQIHDLETRSIDFVLAFPQADLDVDVFMELPWGYSPVGVDEKYARRYVLRLNKSLYGLKQAAFNWYQMLDKGLRDRNFTPSHTDKCVFLRSDCIVLCYVDDCILIHNRGTDVGNRLVKSLQDGPENFILEDEGSLDKYLGVDVDRRSDGSIHFSQPGLINRFLQLVCVEEHEKSKDTPAIRPLLHRDLDGHERRYGWNYRQAVGMLGYLQGSTRPDIATAVHQCARFCTDPKLSHERAIRRIGKYLQGNKDKGIIFRPDKSKGLECFVDADFAGGWNQTDPDNAENVMSRTGFTIMYAGCPVTWCSKLQTEIALSTAEAEYIALSQALREVIPAMRFLEELAPVIDLHIPTPNVHCNVFEDNTACISMATSKKFSPRTKHIALKYHHFRAAVDAGKIKIFHIATDQQLADIFTKPLKVDQFTYLRKQLIGW